MADSFVKYREIRFVIEDELTQVYVHCEASGDSPIGVQGWHHKTFPPSKTVLDIIQDSFGGRDDCVLWPLNAPES